MTTLVKSIQGENFTTLRELREIFDKTRSPLAGTGDFKFAGLCLRGIGQDQKLLACWLHVHNYFTNLCYLMLKLPFLYYSWFIPLC